MEDSSETPVELCGHCGRDGEMVGHIHSYLDKRFLAVCISLLWIVNITNITTLHTVHNHNNVILTFGLQTDSPAGASGWWGKWQLNFCISTNNQRHFLFLLSTFRACIYSEFFSAFCLITVRRCQSCQNKSNDVQVTSVWTEHYISTKGLSLGSHRCPDHLQERCLLRANTQATTLFPCITLSSSFLFTQRSKTPFRLF